MKLNIALLQQISRRADPGMVFFKSTHPERAGEATHRRRPVTEACPARFLQSDVSIFSAKTYSRHIQTVDYPEAHSYFG
jgi:hypothetical protein